MRDAPTLPRLSIVDGTRDAPAVPDVPAAEVWYDDNGDAWGHRYRLDGRQWVRFPGLATFVFDGTADLVEAIPHRPGQLARIFATYHHAILPMALQLRGLEALHASAVRVRAGVVAFCGASGTGKSTLAYALSRRGYPLWADDTTVVETAGDAVRSVFVPCRTYLRSDAAAALAADRPTVGRATAARPSAEVVGDPAPLAAVVILRRRDDSADRVGVRAVPLPPPGALRAVLAHAGSFAIAEAGGTDRKRRMIGVYLAVAATVPVLELQFRAGLEHLPAVLDAVEPVVREVVTR